MSINVFLSGYDAAYKPLSAVILLVFSLRIQELLSPYKKRVFNELEFREMAASVVTLYSGLLFL